MFHLETDSKLHRLHPYFSGKIFSDILNIRPKTHEIFSPAEETVFMSALTVHFPESIPIAKFFGRFYK